MMSDTQANGELVQTLGALAQILEKREAEESLRKQRHDVRERRWKRAAAELMIIEDDDFSRQLVENVLKKQYRLTGLATAAKALATYIELAPDLLFLDINLPDASGHDLLEQIIALDPDAYIIMLSGNCDKDNVLQAVSRGAKGFVAKPFSRDKLMQYISRCPTIRP